MEQSYCQQGIVDRPKLTRPCPVLAPKNFRTTRHRPVLVLKVWNLSRHHPVPSWGRARTRTVSGRSSHPMDPWLPDPWCFWIKSCVPVSLVLLAFRMALFRSGFLGSICVGDDIFALFGLIDSLLSLPSWFSSSNCAFSKSCRLGDAFNRDLGTVRYDYDSQSYSYELRCKFQPFGVSFLDLFADEGLSVNTRCKVELFDVVTCSSLSKNSILRIIWLRYRSHTILRDP